MARVRISEMEIVRVYGEQEMRCPVHLHVGQEAIPAGIAVALGDSGRVFGSHRSHGPYLALGGDLGRFYKELYGRQGGACEGRGGSMHLIDRSVGYWGSSAIVGGTIPIAVGAAFAAQYEAASGGRTPVTACFFGDGAVDEGVFYESLNYAAVESLPILFVCENNGYATNSSQATRQRQTDLSVRARAFGVEAETVDGNDVEAVWSAATRAVNRARRGDGPSFIEAQTCRWFAHVGPRPDHGPDGPRDSDEVEEWKSRCPLRALRDRYPQESDRFDEIDGELKESVSAARRKAQEAPFPRVEPFLVGGWR